jgi:hypothetical protein
MPLILSSIVKQIFSPINIYIDCFMYEYYCHLFPIIKMVLRAFVIAEIILDIFYD